MPEAEDVRAEIERANARICELYAQGDADRLAEAFAEDCWQMAPHAEPLVGRVDKGNYVVLWRHEQDGAWRVAWDAPVSTVPLPPPAV